MDAYQLYHCGPVVLYELTLNSEPGVLLWERVDGLVKTFCSYELHILFVEEPVVKNDCGKEEVAREIDEVLVWNWIVTARSRWDITSSVRTNGRTLMRWWLRTSIDLPMVLEDIGRGFRELKNNEYQLLVNGRLVTLISLSSI